MPPDESIVSIPQPITSPVDLGAIAKSTHDSLESAIAAIPAGDDGALFIRATTANGQPALQAMTATKLGGNWKFGAGVTFQAHEKPAAEVLLMDSWKW